MRQRVPQALRGEVRTPGVLRVLARAHRGPDRSRPRGGVAVRVPQLPPAGHQEATHEGVLHVGKRFSFCFTRSRRSAHGKCATRTSREESNLNLFLAFMFRASFLRAFYSRGGSGFRFEGVRGFSTRVNPLAFVFPVKFDRKRPAIRDRRVYRKHRAVKTSHFAIEDF